MPAARGQAEARARAASDLGMAAGLAHAVSRRSRPATPAVAFELGPDRGESRGRRVDQRRRAENAGDVARGWLSLAEPGWWLCLAKLSSPRVPAGGGSPWPNYGWL